MKSLAYLNTFSQTSISITDNRPAKVIFDRRSPLRPIDQVQEISNTSTLMSPGINIVEIINPEIANVRYQITTYTGTVNPMPVNTISWASLPSGVTLTTVGNTYTLSGINTLSQWEAVKKFTWNVSANWWTYPLWYAEANIIYYDQALGSDVNNKWLIYDDRFYWVATISATSSLSAALSKAKVASASISSTSTATIVADRAKSTPANLQATTSIVAEGSLVVATITSTSALTAALKANYRPTINLAATSTLTANATPIYTDDLRLQIYHTPTRNTFTATINNSGNAITVFWGDGTNSTFTGTGDRTISKSYSGTGYKDIKIVATSMTKFRSNIGSSIPYIYKVYNWGRTAASAPFLLIGALADQSFLNEVPTSFPSSVTSLEETFRNCTSLNDPNISSWNLGNVTSMYYALAGCTSFNQSINSWNLANVSSLQGALSGCTSFNLPLVIDPKQSTNMRQMFTGCTSFNNSVLIIVKQNIDMEFMFHNTNINSENLNKLLISLANQVYANTLLTNIKLGYPITGNINSTVYSGSPYNTGLTSQAYLVSKGWTLQSDAPVVEFTGSSTIAEGNVASYYMQILAEYRPNAQYSINLAFGGNAVAGQDYQATFYADSDATLPLTLPFTPSNALPKNIYVKTLDSNNPHPRTLTILTSDVSNANISPTSVTTSITGTP